VHFVLDQVCDQRCKIVVLCVFLCVFRYDVIFAGSLGEGALSRPPPPASPKFLQNGSA